MRLFSSLTSITFSPIVTIEPRRRKFHCPIRLKIPLPVGYRSESSANLHLLCSITGGQNRAIWEDVTGSTPLSIVDDCLVFTTTVSARFWLVHCKQAQHCLESTKFASEIYRHLTAVPFMAKFVIFAKRRDINEANIRVFCMTDDKEERTLEVQEHYSQVARSRDVEVIEGQTLFLEFAGNLIPTHLASSRGRIPDSNALINKQLAFSFRAFQENRLAFAVRLKEVGQEPSGRIAFMEDSIRYLASLNAQQRAYLSERRRKAVCTLGVQLPPMCVNYDNILGTPKRNSYYASARIGDLTLADIANELDTARRPPDLDSYHDDDDSSLASPRGRTSNANTKPDTDSLYDPNSAPSSDWLRLAPKLGIPRDELDFIADYCVANEIQQGRALVSPALILLMHWFKLASPDTRDQDLARALVSIGREDIAKRLNFPIEPKRMSRSTMELLREIELIPVRSSENLYANVERLDFPARGNSLRRLDNQPPTSNLRRQTSRSGNITLPASRDTDHDQDSVEASPTSAKDWPEDNRRTINLTVEQTTFVETKPRGSGKKQRRKRDVETGGASDMSPPMDDRRNELEANKLERECNEPFDSNTATAIMGEGLSLGWSHEPLGRDSTAKLAAESREEQALKRRSSSTSSVTILASDDQTELPDHLAGKIQIEAPARATHTQQKRHPERLANDEESSREASLVWVRQQARLRLDDSLAGQPCVGHDLDSQEHLAQLDLRSSAQIGDSSLAGGTTSSEVAIDSAVIKAAESFSSSTMGAFYNAQAPAFNSAPSGLRIGLQGENLGAKGFVEGSVRSGRVESGPLSDLDSVEVQLAASRGLGSTGADCDGARPAEQQAEFKDTAERNPILDNELADPTDRNADLVLQQRFVESNDLERTGSFDGLNVDCGEREGCVGGAVNGASLVALDECCWDVVQSCIEAVALGLCASDSCKTDELASERTFAAASTSVNKEDYDDNNNNSRNEHNDKTDLSCALIERTVAGLSHLIETTSSGVRVDTERASTLNADRGAEAKRTAQSKFELGTARAPARRFSSEQVVFKARFRETSQLNHLTARKLSAPTALKSTQRKPVSDQSIECSQSRPNEFTKFISPEHNEVGGHSTQNNHLTIYKQASQASINQSSKEENSSESSRTYKTAPLTFTSHNSSLSANLDGATFSGTSVSQYETAKSRLSNELIGQSKSDNTISEMVSFSMEDAARLRPLAGLRPNSASNAASSPETGSATITPNTEELEDSVSDVLADAMLCEQQEQHRQQTNKRVLKGFGATNRSDRLSSVEPPVASCSLSTSPVNLYEDERQTNQINPNDADIIDEDQLRRILTCKRLSEGCNKLSSSFIRKNSLHIVDELPPLTEGETMKHMSCHMSQNTIEHSAASSGSSGSLRQSGRLVGNLSMKRGSQDENTTSCSSSTSLERSPTRRRSSTISQCSSVLSEGTRNQLNFDLSPDLAPDSSLLEANRISPTDFQDERPASPEPSSFSGEAFDFRPTSRVSDCIPEDELLQLNLSPQSTTFSDSKDSNDLVATDPAYSPQDNCMQDVAMEQSANIVQSERSSGDNGDSEQPMAISDDSNIVNLIEAPILDRRTEADSRSDSPMKCFQSSTVRETGERECDHQLSEQKCSESSIVQTNVIFENNKTILPQLIGSPSSSAALVQRTRPATPDSTCHAQTITQRTSQLTPEATGSSSKRQHWLADSTCSSSSHSLATSRSSSSQHSCADKSQNKKTVKDGHISLNVIALERKDLLRKSPVSPHFIGLSSNDKLYKRPPVVGHQHSSTSSTRGTTAMCYCHQH